MDYEKKQSDIDTTIQWLQGKLDEQEQKVRWQEQERLAFPSDFLNIAQGAFSTFSMPGLDSAAVLQTVYQLASRGIESIRKDLKEDPTKLLIKASVAAAVLLVVLKSLKGRN